MRLEIPTVAGCIRLCEETENQGDRMPKFNFRSRRNITLRMRKFQAVALIYSANSRRHPRPCQQVSPEWLLGLSNNSPESAIRGFSGFN